MARSDSEDEDTFVTIGTALPSYEEDEALKKPYNIQEQRVTDSKGRQRFHGAFTGGFSAGYFNTVGSKDGWTPSTFVSSRQTRGEQSQRKPEDFMDEDDLGEYGIAPRVVQATDDFTSLKGQQRKRPHVTDGIIPGTAPLADLIVPARLPVGVKLLRKLGWRDGQGIGPRQRKKTKHRAREESKKVYGCALPSNVDLEASESSDEADDITTKDITFAPKDVNPVRFLPKDNLHGLGYSGITPQDSTGRPELFSPPSASGRRGKKGITGAAFGVGALEEDDEDIYATTSMSQYDTIIGGTDSNKTHGWTAPKHHGGHAPKDYVDVVLEGFKLLSTQLQPKKVFSPPALPRGYKPHHTFTAAETQSSQQAAQIPRKFSMSWKKIDVSERREALGETVEIKSVFDLVNQEDQKKLDDAKQSRQVEPQSGPAAIPGDMGSAGGPLGIGSAGGPLASFNIQDRFTSAGTEITSDNTSSDGGPQVPASQPQVPVSQPLFQGSRHFKPFAKDLAKQARYEKYIDCMKHKKNYEEDKEVSGHMTEWERGKEREEFAKAVQLYRPMSAMMASRFTRAQYEDNDKVVMNKEQRGPVDDQAKAAELKMYGKLTRDRLEWHPDKLLCKRFNVPNPYPDSSIKGLPRVKREKFSVFNFLSFPGEAEAEVPPTEQEAEPEEAPSSSKKQLGRQSKPLAILASIDLRRPRSSVTKVKDTGQTEGSETDNTQSDSQTADNERPPLDVFKAIFGDSDAEESSQSDEGDESHTPEAEPLPIEYIESTKPEPDPTPPDKPPDNIFSRLFGGETSDVSNSKGDPSKTDPFSRLFGASETSDKDTLQNTPESSSAEQSGLTNKLSESGSAEPDGVRLSLSMMAEHRKRLEHIGVYGPSLPPPTAGESIKQISNKDQPKKKKKNNKDQEKSKHKKKKSKHKKHKSKHKKERKKKKKETIVISSSDTSASDSESSSNSVDAPSDAQLLDRMRSLSKRMTAADYM